MSYFVGSKKFTYKQFVDYLVKKGQYRLYKNVGKKMQKYCRLEGLPYLYITQNGYQKVIIKKKGDYK